MPKLQIEAIDLMKLMRAIEGPPHHIRELIATRGLPIGSNVIDNIVSEMYTQQGAIAQALMEENENDS